MARKPRKWITCTACEWKTSRTPPIDLGSPCPRCGGTIRLARQRKASPGLSIQERLLFHAGDTPSDICWRWPGNHLPNGYGRITVNGKGEYVHRIAHEAFIGPIPEGFEVDHVAERGCVHKDCFNPTHLEAVTPQVNTDRAPRPHASKTHCPRNHPYSGDNLYINPTSGGRCCRTCQRTVHRKAS